MGEVCWDCGRLVAGGGTVQYVWGGAGVEQRERKNGRFVCTDAVGGVLGRLVGMNSVCRFIGRWVGANRIGRLLGRWVGMNLICRLLGRWEGSNPLICCMRGLGVVMNLDCWMPGREGGMYWLVRLVGCREGVILIGRTSGR